MFGGGCVLAKLAGRGHSGRQIAADRMHKKQIGQLLKSR